MTRENSEICHVISPSFHSLASCFCRLGLWHSSWFEGRRCMQLCKFADTGTDVEGDTSVRRHTTEGYVFLNSAVCTPFQGEVLASRSRFSVEVIKAIATDRAQFCRLGTECCSRSAIDVSAVVFCSFLICDITGITIDKQRRNLRWTSLTYLAAADLCRW